MKTNLITLILSSLFLSCNPGRINVTFDSSKSRPQVTSVRVQSNQIFVTGEDLSDVTQAKISGASSHSLKIESKASTELVLIPTSAIKFIVSETYNLFIANAHGSSSFPISFELKDGQVTAAKLHHMGASSGQVLKFNGTSWLPSNATSSQTYAGTYNAVTDSPDIVSLGGVSGTFYIVDQAGTQDLGSGPIAFNIGDWVIYNGVE